MKRVLLDSATHTKVTGEFGCKAEEAGRQLQCRLKTVNSLSSAPPPCSRNCGITVCNVKHPDRFLSCPSIQDVYDFEILKEDMAAIDKLGERNLRMVRHGLCEMCLSSFASCRPLRVPLICGVVCLFLFVACILARVYTPFGEYVMYQRGSHRRKVTLELLHDFVLSQSPTFPPAGCLP